MPEYRNELNTFCQKKWRRQDVPEYVVSEKVGSPSSARFEAVCYIDKKEYSRAFRSSMDKAREAAAEVALVFLRKEYPGIYDKR